jgi:predicted nuclease with TOPRIM domain
MSTEELKELGELVKQLSDVNEQLKERRSWRIHVDRTRAALPGTVEKLKALYKKLAGAQVVGKS